MRKRRSTPSGARRLPLPPITLAMRMLPQSDKELVRVLLLPRAEIAALREDATTASPGTQLMLALALYEARERVVHGQPDSIATIAGDLYDDGRRRYRAQLIQDIVRGLAGGIPETEIRRIVEEALERIEPDEAENNQGDPE